MTGSSQGSTGLVSVLQGQVSIERRLAAVPPEQVNVPHGGVLIPPPPSRNQTLSRPGPGTNLRSGAGHADVGRADVRDGGAAPEGILATPDTGLPARPGHGGAPLPA